MKEPFSVAPPTSYHHILSFKIYGGFLPDIANFPTSYLPSALIGRCSGAGREEASHC